MNDNPYLNEESRGAASGMSGFVLGAIVGAGVALLFAPAAGNDTRRKLGETAKKLGSAARDRIQEGKDRIQEGAEKIQDRFQSERQGFESGRQAAGTGSTTTPGSTGRVGTTPTPGRTNP